jgi:WD40 repeat protein
MTRKALTYHQYANCVSNLTMLSDNTSFAHEDYKDIYLCTYITASNSYNVYTTLISHKDYIWGIAYDKKNNYLVSGDRGKIIILWNLANNMQIKSFNQHTGEVSGIVILEGNRFASSSHDHTIRVWSYKNSKPNVTIKKHTGWVNRVYNLVDLVHREVLIAAGSDKKIGFYDTNGNVLGQLMTESWAYRVAFFKDMFNRVHIAHIHDSKDIWLWNS